MSRLLAASAAVALLATPAAAQSVARLASDPGRISVAAGDSVPFTVRALDATGRALDVPLRMGAPREGLRLGDGWVVGLVAGDYAVYVTSVPGNGEEPTTLAVPVTVTWPAGAAMESSG